MAPVLQCPDCGTKHPLAEVADAGRFPCKGCGRQLKVPEMAPRGAGTGAPGPAPVIPPVTANPTTAQPAAAAEPAPATRMLPVVEQNAPRPAPAAAAAFRPVPMWMRAILWLVALPLSFLLVFGFARAIGVLTSNQLTDVYLAPGSGRFWPVVRLLPFVALLTAAFVQGGVVLLGRRRGGRDRAGSRGSAQPV
jgi:hypothetical protein